MPDLNGVMLQAFHWYVPADGTLWDDLAQRAVELAAAGFTALWLPPAAKGLGGAGDVGYGVYDLYDLGEFEQHGSVRTKYGTRAQFLAALGALRAAGLQIYADVVLNHRIGADAFEVCPATPFPRGDRLQPKGPPRAIRAHTRFTFPGRAGVHSTFTWSHRHFDAVDWDGNAPDEHDTVYLLEGKRFDDAVSLEFGNFAYLLGCDLDFQDPEVREEMARWGRWMLDTTGVDGFRLDAIKHISSWFFPDWLDAMERHVGRDIFVVGEYWTDRLATLTRYLDAVGGRMAVFDVPLHYNLQRAGREGAAFDLRRVLEGSLAAARPTQAVTFVDNHDSQPLQALESPVEAWFKPLAYALILLRREGYPCVFFADYFGADYEDQGRDGNRHRIFLPSHRVLLDRLLAARRDQAYGEQRDWFDHPNVVGWTRLGDDRHPSALAVLMSNGDDGWKWMDVGRREALFDDVTGCCPEPVRTNADGWGEFRCRGGSVSVWVQRTA